METDMGLAFINVPFRHNSTCVIHKWLKLKSDIKIRLAYISKIFLHGFEIIQLF